MFFSGDIEHPKWTEWCNKTQEESEKIAEEKGWYWYFDWFDIGDILRCEYEKADKSPNVTKKYNGYDRWDEEHETKYSYIYLGSDASFHESKAPTNQWTEYNPCTNINCRYNQGEYANKNVCGYFGCNERMYDCFNEVFASIQAFIDVCGIDDIDTLQTQYNIHQDLIGWFKYGDKYFNNKKGDDNMSKPFWVALSELKVEDELSVFWTENMMYINDDSDGQATTNVSLFQAYKFAVLINATYFDYTATDEEVKELGEEILDLVDEDFYRVDIWKYFDDIQNDFLRLTNINIGIDDKRQIVSAMTEIEENDSVHLRGSATFIAKLLWDYIKGNKNLYINNKQHQGCDNKTINQLADKYLQTDEYDIQAFAKALHEEAKKHNEVCIKINGALWVNCAKYEYVDKIIIEKDDVVFYCDNKIIGSIARESIKTIQEEYHDDGGIYNIEDVINFDIRKVGDF